MGLETELKFRVSARRLASYARPRIKGAQIGPRTEKELVSTYFDTRKHKLHRKGLSLRVRTVGDQRIQTIKAANGGNLARSEWETKIKGRSPDLDQSEGTPLEPLVSKKLHRKLRPVFHTAVNRTTVPVQLNQSEVELAIDRGKIFVGRKSSPIAEIELELKKGEPRDLFRVAKAVGVPSHAELDLRSKAQIGYELTSADEPAAVYAEPITLSKQSRAEEAFRAIAFASIRHFSGNADAVRSLQSEGVHQMRVGLRRLRAAISLFSDILPGARTEAIKTELKWLTNELAPAREMDVFVKELVKPVARDATTRRGGRALEREFMAQRAAGFERARRAVDSARFRRLLLDLVEWVELLSDASQASDPSKRKRIAKLAPVILRRRIKKARKQGLHLDQLAPEARHKLRIKIKKIRYGLGFLESLFHGRQAEDELVDLSEQLKKIQSALGTLNDFVAHRKIVADAALRAPPRDRRARAFALGVILGKEQEATKLLMKAATKAVHGLRPLKADPA